MLITSLNENNLYENKTYYSENTCGGWHTSEEIKGLRDGQRSEQGALPESENVFIEELRAG